MQATERESLVFAQGDFVHVTQILAAETDENVISFVLVSSYEL